MIKQTQEINIWYNQLCQIARDKGCEGIIADKEEYEQSYYADNYTPEDTFDEELSYCDFDLSLIDEEKQE